MASTTSFQQLPIEEQLPTEEIDDAEQKARLISILKEIVPANNGGIDFDNLTPDELKSILLSISSQLAHYYITPAGAKAALDDGLDKTDVGYHTFLRLWQVFGNVAANGTNSDNYNDNNSFNQVVSDPAAAWSLGAASVIPAALGFLIRIRQIQRTREVNSIAHQQALLSKIAGRPYSEQEVLSGYQDFCDRSKVVPESLRWTDPHQGKTDKVIGTNPIADFVNKIKSTKTFAAVSTVWDTLTQAALVFWPLWMIAVLIVGIAASYAFPVLPILIIVTIGVTAAIQGGLMYAKHRAKKNSLANELQKDMDPEEAVAEQKDADNEAADTIRMTSEMRQRKVMKDEHNKFKSLFWVPFFNKSNTNTSSNGYAVGTDKNGVLIFLKKPGNEHSTAQVEKKMSFKDHPELSLTKTEKAEHLRTEQRELDAHKAKMKFILDSNIGKRLLGSKASRVGRIAVSMFNDTIGYYTLSSFILWVVGSAVLCLAPVSAFFGFAGLGGLILGAIVPGVSAGFSGIVGAIYGMNAFANTRNNQLAFENTVYTRLNEPYKNTGKTTAAYFDEMYAKVEQSKLDVQAIQKTLANKVKKGEALTFEEAYIYKLNLKDIDVFNDRYMRTGEHSPSAWVTTKKVAFSAYKAINAGQTLIFVTRSLFLAGAALAGICLLFGPGAGIAFVAIAATLAVIGIGFKMAQLYNEQKAADKKAFVDSMPVRISYLRKQDKELTAMKDYISTHKPANDHQHGGGSTSIALDVLTQDTDSTNIVSLDVVATNTPTGSEPSSGTPSSQGMYSNIKALLATASQQGPGSSHVPAPVTPH